MQLMIEGKSRTFQPLQSFREEWHLPPDFTLDLFEPKDWEGLGTMDDSNEALTQIRIEVLESIPEMITTAGLMGQIQLLTTMFRYQMEQTNVKFGLKSVEIDFAVAGFHDVIHRVVFQLIQLYHTHQGDVAQIREYFEFKPIYQAWLDDSTRLSTMVHPYSHNGTEFKVRIVNYAYGRVGMEVEIADEVYYVLDMSLACPAASYMRDLCRDVAEALCSGFLAGLEN